MKCQNPNCDNETNSEHSKFCRKCSLRHQGKKAGYTLDEREIEGEDYTGFVLKRSDLK
jgi:hypothetical protein